VEANYHNLAKIGQALLDYDEYCEYGSKDYNELYEWFQDWLTIQGIIYINSHNDQQMMIDFINFAHENNEPGSHTVWLKSKTIDMNAIFMKNHKFGSTKCEAGFTAVQLKNKKWNIFGNEDKAKKVLQIEDAQMQPLLTKGTALETHKRDKK